MGFCGVAIPGWLNGIGSTRCRPLLPMYAAVATQSLASCHFSEYGNVLRGSYPPNSKGWAPVVSAARLGRLLAKACGLSPKGGAVVPNGFAKVAPLTAVTGTTEGG